MRKLFVSFTGLLQEMVNGRVTKEDLADGIFSFGCMREHALRPWEDETNEVEWIARDVGDERAKEIHAQIVEALWVAEAHGRAQYRTDESNSYEKLNVLIVANGYPELPCSVEGLHDCGAYSYSGVEDRVRALGLELEVVYY
ncbi:hypothetical protein A3E96_03705 [Candidatus Uhrbacteria bacterium RIFCSPHIGHO2_12_FULL_46_13]|nr:MAG: hypothetical protein UX68_C0008G0051 [Parcubacteria group bacterium GW2011_GWA2_46_9]OGL60492.1 MAG: hypothetical protein A2752_05340 [Candidatus Uhrbacteria bacterium RIFCSPHIGHO2_01_FULL_46_23]OGL75533.1 MAG: hypothetical protein A3E96_03705 [Candidatus Uhrbacteria bacterium RIFCSPHIGHO2_12_FULL_46_13]